jgi:cytochrome c peroxidase
MCYRLGLALFLACFAVNAWAGDLYAPDDIYSGGQIFLQGPPLVEETPRHAVPPIESLAKLGERLFFERRLSRSGRMACATCHNPNFAFAQPKDVPIFDSGRLGTRNAPSLLTARFLPRLMWDGRFRSLEDQVFAPISVSGEMGISPEEAADRLAADPAYERLFHHILGEPPSPRGIAAALAAFERTLVAGWSPFDRFSLRGEEGALNGFERSGFELFRGKAGCARCHTLPEPNAKAFGLFTDFGFHNLGVGFRNGRFADRGLAAISGRIEHTGAFRTPSLRNVAVTAPYMHDGSLPSLHDVIEFYNAGGQPNPYQSPLLRPLGLRADEKEALVAFLNTLTTADYGRPLGLAGREEAFFGSRD